MQEDNIIGVLGGMGPMATAVFYKHLINLADAKTDQEHPKVIIYSNPKIPDRTKYILGQADNPLEYLIFTAKELEKLNVSVITIPCNTAHYFYDELQKSIKIPILNMIKETQNYCIKKFANTKGGLLSTTGTIKTKIYDKYFGDKLIIPDSDIQENLVMEAIYSNYGIKSGGYVKPKELLIKTSEILIDRGAKYIVAGCTEVPIVLDDSDINVPLIDPMKILADKALKHIGYK